MKKKFVLTLALVLMVAASLMAATPLEVSGEFTAGRTFKFDPNSLSVASNAAIDSVSIANDFWKVSLSGGAIPFDGDMEAVADIYLTKALAEQGIDMGDLDITLSVGNKADSSICDVYSDPNDVAELSMVGVAEGTTEVTVKYGTMVTVKGAVNFDATNKPLAVSATFAPVDGVKAAVGYTNYAGATETKGGFGGSVLVDVAALADLDFTLTASAYDVYKFETETNVLNAAVVAGYGDVSVDAEVIVAAATALKVGASYSGIENVGLSANLSIADLSDVTLVADGTVSYTMGGVEYALKAGVDAAKQFYLNPYVTIAF